MASRLTRTAGHKALRLTWQSAAQSALVGFWDQPWVRQRPPVACAPVRKLVEKMSRAQSVEYESFGPLHLDGVVGLCGELDWPSYTDPSIASVALSAPGAVTWVAVSAGEVIGLAQLLTNGRVHAHLSLVGVLPGRRRQGVARELVTRAFRAGGGKWLDLCAEPGSEPFYRSFLHQESPGFRIYPGESAG